jgi:hypothetical protein
MDYLGICKRSKKNMRNIRSKWVVGRSKKWKEGKNECKNIGLTICNKELKIKRLVEWTTL